MSYLEEHEQSVKKVVASVQNGCNSMMTLLSPSSSNSREYSYSSYCDCDDDYCRDCGCLWNCCMIE